MYTLNSKQKLSKIIQLETLNRRNNQVKQPRELQVKLQTKPRKEHQTKLRKKHQTNHLLNRANLA